MNATHLELRIFALGLLATAVACRADTAPSTDAGSTSTSSATTDATSTAPTSMDATWPNAGAVYVY